MQGHVELTGLAAVALVAMIGGMVMTRLKQPAVVGYILAGVVLGPSVMGMVSSRQNVDFLAELGVLLLLFTVGMEMSLRAFRQIWQVALLCTLLQIFGSLAVMLTVALVLGWSTEVGIFFGFILAISSTAVAIKVLEEIGELRTRIGQVAVGVLIAQDLAVVPMLLVVDGLAGDRMSPWVPFKVVVSVVVLVLIIRALSRRERMSLPFGRLIAGHGDLAPLMGLVYCLTGAAVSGFLGLTPAYGAFLAGLVIGNSSERGPMIELTHPIQSVLMMVFFLSIGLLVDLQYIWGNLGPVVLLIGVVTLFKTAFNIALLRLLRQPWTHAFIAGLTLSQLGEFSFLLAQAGRGTALIGGSDYRLIIAVTVMSLVLSPYWLHLMRRLEAVAVPGIASLGDLVRLLYGADAETVRERAGLKSLLAAGHAVKQAVQRAGARWRRGGGAKTAEATDPPPPPSRKGKAAAKAKPRRRRGDG